MESVIESQAFFIPAGHGRRTLVQVGRDITERKQTDEALERRSAQREAGASRFRELRIAGPFRTQNIGRCSQ